MKSSLILFSLAYLMLQSFSIAQSTSPTAYNDKIISEQTKIIQLTLELVDYLETDLAKCEEYRLVIIKQCESSIQIIQKMPAYEGNSDLRNAGLDLFKFYLETYAVGYKRLIEILNKGEEITEDDIAEITEISMAVEEKEIDLDAAFEKAQNEFALKYDFQIEENELQEEIDKM